MARSNGAYAVNCSAMLDGVDSTSKCNNAGKKVRELRYYPAPISAKKGMQHE